MRLLAVIILLLLLSSRESLAEQKTIAGVPLESTNLHNLFVVGDRFYSGSSPEDEKAFQELKDRGIKTIISVDGTPPEVELAKKVGIRYIHIPVGYDGIDEKDAQRLLKAAETFPGPAYIHCHHGKHRGPAAVAAICKGTSLFNEKEAFAWLKQAGASPDYPGLYKVTQFNRPSAAVYQQISTNFPESVAAEGMVEGMVKLDKQWEQVKKILDGEIVRSRAPEQTAAAEAAMLGMEACREMQRLSAGEKYGADFIARMQAGERLFKEVHDGLKNGKIDRETAARLKKEITSSCSSCHKKYRD
ncbi:MAG: hypothetical protein ACO1QB_01865 [Verrucomicrobiales bacterium]